VRSRASGPLGARELPAWPDGSDDPDGPDLARCWTSTPDTEDESMGAVVFGRVERSMGIAIVYAGRLVRNDLITAH